MGERDPDEVLDYWKRASQYRDQNYESVEPDQRTDHDIPEFNVDEEEAIRRRRLNPDAIRPVDMEIGYSLLELVDETRSGDLTERISIIRRKMKEESNFVLPLVTIRDNMNLDPSEYRLKIHGDEVARGTVQAYQMLAMDAGLVAEKLEGVQTTEPAFGYPSVWVDKDLRDRAEALGYVVVSASAVVAAHIDKIFHEQIDKILASQESDCNNPDAYRRSLCGDGIIEADLRTKTLRYITNNASLKYIMDIFFKVSSQITPDWTVAVE